jgi:uncharacterized damage-inducible protein DinB
MAKFKSEELINELKADVQNILTAAEYIKGSEKGKLVYQPAKDKWSVVQVLEHLNAYGRYYLPLIETSVSERNAPKDAWFTSGRMGEYFISIMKPTNVYEIKNKMKAMKDYSFQNSLNVENVVNEFLDQQQKMLQLLDNARESNLNTIRIPITLTKMLKLKLGDIFRFLIAHEQRHMIQARNTLKTTGVATDKFPVILRVAAR